ncbi:MAG: alpha/beta hydrolase [Thiothrix sp.]|nr:alpha/beta hydrolase [Thiothrix sp.]HPQ96885.1 alpha/beta hydrolase [Thiolinea sp.]
MRETITFPNTNNPTITLSAFISFPDGFDAQKTYPVIVVTHPGGGVKQQTAGVYAENLAKAGFISIATDASYQGESTGEPRQLENPYIRTEDISAVIDYLSTQPYVDLNRIGAMGICAGGGYSINAAINDKRIKAVATVSAVNIGAMLRYGWLGDQDVKNATPFLEAGAQARTAEAAGGEVVTFPLAPCHKEDTPYVDLQEAWEYYHTARAEFPTSPGFGTTRSLTQIVTYDAFNMAETFLTQPLLVIAGSVAQSLWMSEDLMQRAGSPDKQLYLVEGSNHMKLYDIPEYVNEAVEQLIAFFRKHLSA